MQRRIVSGLTFSCVAPSSCLEAGTCNPADPARPVLRRTEGLIGYWPLDYDGTDLSGGGHHLTNEGAVQAPGRIGLGMV